MTISEIPLHQAPTVYRRKVGNVVVTLLNDGYQDHAFESLHAITPADVEELLSAARLPPSPRMPVHAFLVQDGQRTTLIDSGDANIMGTGGHLLTALRTAGVEPAQIDTVLLTHAHPDHLGGLIDSGGKRVFPHAELVLHGEELRFWSDPANFHAEREHFAPFHALALRVFDAYHPSIRPVGSGTVLPGIALEPLPGHTPGHSGYWIESNGEKLLIWGDIVHLADIQIPRPEVGLAFDIDPQQAADTRRAILERAVAENLLIAGMHLHFPGFARIRREEDRYIPLLERWSPALG